MGYTATGLNLRGQSENAVRFVFTLQPDTRVGGFLLCSPLFVTACQTTQSN